MFTPKNKEIVMAFGTFDVFHAGHEFYLKKAKELGEYLVVVIARDRTVRHIKGHKTTNNEWQRMSILKKTGLADKVILGHHGDKHKVLIKYRPSVIALGYDQFVFTQKLKKFLIDHKMDTVIKRIDAYYPQVYKSSLLKRETMEEAGELLTKLQEAPVTVNK
jgi:FAD synthetase